jgi:hypothetical protein
MKTTINGVTVSFAKVFDGAAHRAAYEEWLSHSPRGCLVSIDLAMTPEVVGVLVDAHKRGCAVTAIDHHQPAVVKSPKDSEYMEGLATLERERVAHLITTREEAPGCLMLVDRLGPVAKQAAESGVPVLVLADQDTDGLLGAMGLCGVRYSGDSQDAAVLDGPRSGVDQVTPYAQLYTRALSALPTFDPGRPEVFQSAWLETAMQFARMVQGYGAASTDASAALAKKAAEFEAAVERADAIPVEQVAPGIVMATLPVSPTGQRPERIDLGTLMRRMEKNSLVTVLVKSEGPLVSVGGHSAQISIAVVKAYQDRVDLRGAVQGLPSGPREGVISNTTFLLHVSPEVYNLRVKAWIENAVAEVLRAEHEAKAGQRVSER